MLILILYHFLIKQHLCTKRKTLNLENIFSSSNYDGSINYASNIDGKEINKEFFIDLCKIFINADVSLSKIKNSLMQLLGQSKTSLVILLHGEGNM